MAIYLIFQGREELTTDSYSNLQKGVAQPGTALSIYATLLTDHEPTEAEITLALTRRGTPTWTDSDFQTLLYTLGCAGYGWLRPEGVRQQLEVMVVPH